MTRLEILEKKSEKIYDKINLIESRIENINSRKNNEMKIILEKYIDTFDGFKVNYFHDRVSIYVHDANYSILDISIYDEWSREEGRNYQKITFNTSSFRTEFGKEDMNWAAERFKMLAFYSAALLDFSDDILAEFNLVNNKYGKLIEALYEFKRPLNKEVKEVNEMISKIEDEEMVEKLMSNNGLMIENKEDDSYLPSFQVKFDWELNSVKSIRGLKKTASGKSIDLEVAVRRGYGEDKKLEVIKIDKVRFDNVKNFINRNSNSIV